MNGISAFKKETSESSLCEDIARTQLSMNQEAETTESASSLVLDFQPP